MAANTKRLVLSTRRVIIEAEDIWLESSSCEPFHDTGTDRSCRSTRPSLPARTQGIRNVGPIQQKTGGRKDDD